MQGQTVIEASSIVRSFQAPGDKKLSAFAFAEQLLQDKGRDVIARKILELYRLDPDSSFVITGFRTIEELDVIRHHCPQVQVMLVDAGVRTRFARFLHRGRDGIRSLDAFRRLDSEQESFGLLRVAEDFADIRIKNEDSLEQFGSQVLSVLANPSRPNARGVSTQLHPPGGLKVHRLYRCLVVLAQASAALTCAQIATAAGGSLRPGGPRYAGRTITPNNVNKILKSAGGLATRSRTPTGEASYVITDIGRSYIRAMKESGAGSGAGDGESSDRP
jgi:hypothetical protein